MKKQFLILFLVFIVFGSLQAQTKGTKIGFIDMEYILENVPDYTEAQTQLEEKAQGWKQQIEAKKAEINKLKEALAAEKALLTKELIAERETEIRFLENENLDYQQKRFGPQGDLILQKSTLTKPIQDQVFTAIQDIAEAKKYDFIFDKTSDLTMLFAAKRFDISDQVLRVLNRSEKREQMTKKEIAAQDAQDAKEDAINENPALAERKKLLEDKKAARDKAMEDRKLLQEQRKKDIEDKKKQILLDKEAKRTGSTADAKSSVNESNTSSADAAKNAAADAKQKQADDKARILEERKKVIEDRKRAVEEKKQQILEEREAKKNASAKVDSKTTETVVDEKPAEVSKTVSAAETKQKQADEKAKVLEERKKLIEDQKKAAEEKRKQILQEREAKKIGTVSETKVKEVVKEEVKQEVKPTEKVAEQVSKVVGDSTKMAAPVKLTPQELKQKQLDARNKILEDRKKLIEENKKALEEKKKKILEERAAKQGTK